MSGDFRPGSLYRQAFEEKKFCQRDLDETVMLVSLNICGLPDHDIMYGNLQIFIAGMTDWFAHANRRGFYFYSSAVGGGAWHQIERRMAAACGNKLQGLIADFHGCSQFCTHCSPAEKARGKVVRGNRARLTNNISFPAKKENFNMRGKPHVPLPGLNRNEVLAKREKNDISGKRQCHSPNGMSLHNKPIL